MPRKKKSTKQINAIPTTYDGTEYRSRLEARWAIFLEKHKHVLSFKYEPQLIHTSTGFYNPDFKIKYRTSEKRYGYCYLEIKPCKISSSYYEKLKEAAATMTPTELFVCCGNIYKDNVPKVIRIPLTGRMPRPLKLTSFLPHSEKPLALASSYRFDIV